MSHPPLVLASASPRRREILASLGLTFAVQPVEGINEDQLTAAFDGPPQRVAAHLARIKAQAAAALAPPKALTIAADTIVVLNDHLLGKPQDPAEAAMFLRALSGRTHEVITGVAIHDGTTGHLADRSERTAVTFAALTEADIAGYVASREPFDKAGGYGIQGLGSLFITGIAGDYWNVVGFPVYAFRMLLSELGYDLAAWVWTGHPAAP